MKKFLFLIAAVLLSTAINAQIIDGKHCELLSKNPDAKTEVYAKGMKKAVAKKVALANNQRVLGWYTNDEYSRSGIGLASMPGDFPVATYWPASLLKKYAGGKVVKLRFALAEKAEVSRAFIITVLENGMVGTEYSLPVSDANVGWNEVALDAPCELITDGSVDYLVGYEYTQVKNAYPLGINENAEGNIFVYGNLGSSGVNWYDAGDYCLAVQAVVEFDNLEAHHVILNDFYTDGMYAKAGSTMAYGLKLENFGSETPADYTIDIAIDGKVISTVKSPIALANEPKEYEGVLTLPGNLASGEHILTASIASVAGEAPVSAYTNEAKVFVYQNSVERQKFLVEQATSHSCTYCPLGENVLSKLAEKCDLAWVAIHGNMQSTDPYYIAESENWFYMVGLRGFPSATFNRLEEDGSLALGLGYSESYANDVAEYYAMYMNYLSAPAFATVNIETKYNNETKALDIKVSGDAVEDFKKIYGEDAVLTVYLTENGLVNRQLNQGRWIAKYNHEHVLRKYVTPYNGEQIVWSGNSYENDYNVTLNADWNVENMNVIAFLTRKIDINNIDITKMDVNNAEIVKIGDSSAGISSAISENDKVEVARYTIDGRKVSVSTKGVNIVKLNNGKTVKVIR